MKIRIKRANTAAAYTLWLGYNKPYGMVQDYLDELRQQAKWDSEKCQRES